jgi:23S rRNA (cytosine1962-C5)-methyltransferase
MAKAILKKGEGRLLKRGGLWVFDNEIDRVDREFANGDLVKIEDFDGYPMGVGVINTNSKIRIRVLSRNSEEEINEAFWEKRVKAAVDYRLKTVDTACCRLIFGEADYLPGIVVDKYADILVIQSLSLGTDRFKEDILSALKKILAENNMPVRGIYERSDARERIKEGMEYKTGFIGEPFDTKVEIVENGVHYMVDVENGQKTGFFLDQKYNRLAIQKICKDARVLDCFTHTGSFALNAGIGGAKDVLGVDVSETGIAQAEENARLNHLEDRVHFQCADVFDLLPKLEQEKEEFDVVILDPPAFTKSKASVKNATKGYREINLRGMRLVKDMGYFVTCSCSHFMTYELFTQMIRQAAAAAHVTLRQVEFREQSPDHPILWAAEESYYLKFYIFQVIRHAV